jgi:hypothetical protein
MFSLPDRSMTSAVTVVASATVVAAVTPGARGWSGTTARTPVPRTRPARILQWIWSISLM